VVRESRRREEEEGRGGVGQVRLAKERAREWKYWEKGRSVPEKTKTLSASATP
jgi:hypothetical protein